MNKKAPANIMVDLETLGTTPNCVVLSIAAVEFNLETGETGRQFYRNLDIDNQQQYGRTIDGDTLKWWVQKPAEVFRKCFEETQYVAPMRHDFDKWLKEIWHDPKQIQVWCNGLSFDMALMRMLYKGHLAGPSWHYRNERDVRTIVMLAPEIMEAQEDIGQAHDPISDCLYQIAYLCKTWQRVNRGLLELANLEAFK